MQNVQSYGSMIRSILLNIRAFLRELIHISDSNLITLYRTYFRALKSKLSNSSNVEAYKSSERIQLVSFPSRLQISFELIMTTLLIIIHCMPTRIHV